MSKNKNHEKYDIIIIGGGPGGYVAAIKASMLGAKVALVEKEFIGGTCLNVGCIPTKALVRSAEVLEEIKGARSFGISVSDYKIDMKKIISRKNRVVKQLAKGTEQLVLGHGAEIYEGTGRIVSTNTVEVITEKETIKLQTDNIIIATGAKARSLNIPITDNGNVIFSRDALNIDELPKSIVIVGGGVIGMEFAFIYSILGVDVTVVEYQDKILSALDDDVIEELMRIARRRKIKIINNAAVVDINDQKNDKCLVKYKKNNETIEIEAAKVLMSVGRKPYLENLGLENIDVKINKNNGGIDVNEKMETNIKGIYAVGDVTNKIQLAHVASYQGIIAVENILGNKTKMDYTAIPSAIFTNPEISVVGVTEKQAKSENRDILVGKFALSASGKALVQGTRDGFVKVVKDKVSDKIIGAAIIGSHATDLISEFTLAIQNGITAGQIERTIHAHPTIAEAVHEAVLATSGNAIHSINK